MKILRLAAVYAQHAHALGELRIVGRTKAGVAEGAEILARKERQTADHRRCDADARPRLLLRADRLRRVLDDGKT